MIYDKIRLLLDSDSIDYYRVFFLGFTVSRAVRFDHLRIDKEKFFHGRQASSHLKNISETFDWKFETFNMLERPRDFPEF